MSWKIILLILALMTIQCALWLLIEYFFGIVVVSCLFACVLVCVSFVLVECWWTASLDGKTLALDVCLVNRAFNVSKILAKKELFTSDDVDKYYNATTDLDYRVLETFIGPSLHTRLCAAFPVLVNGGYTRQPVMVLMEAMSATLDTKPPLKDLTLPVTSLLSGTVSGRILEVGFGKGHCTFLLASLLPHLQFHGVDRLARHVNVAQSACSKGGYTNVEFFCGDATEFLSSVTDFSYDVIFGVEALCHLDTVAKLKDFVSQSTKRLSHSGRLVVVDGFRSTGFASAAEDQRTAMRLAECGFQIRKMPSKAEWVEEANRVGLHLVKDTNLTSEALPFWTFGWRFARTILRLVPGVTYLLGPFSASNLLSIFMTAHAMNGGTAEYGMLVFAR